MLPYPATASGSPRRPRHGPTSSLSKLASAASLPHINALGLGSSNANVYRRRLFARSPLTNAGVLILAAMLGVSLLVNLGYWIGGGDERGRVREELDWRNGRGSGAERASAKGAQPVLDVDEEPADLPAIHTPSELERLHSVTRPDRARTLDHLIIVPGHAIWRGKPPFTPHLSNFELTTCLAGSNAQLRMSESEWVLEPYQRGGGRIRAFFSHIVRG